MQLSLTSEQILSLAVDKYAIRTTRTWSAREKWLRMGQHQGTAHGHFAWGEFKGKSKTPIQTMVSLTKPLFSCTCSGRKLPCSHALGLRILYFDSPHLFQSKAPPTTDDWLATLTDNSESAIFHTPTADPQPAEEQAAADQARLQRIRKGLDELDLWLGDVVRNGLESVRDKKRSADWQRMAKRLVDAQASELAHVVRKMALIPGSTPRWPEELLTKMGSLHLLVQGFRNFETLPPEVQGDLRMAVGWLPKVDPAAATVLADKWHVVAREQEQVGKQRRHKIWLWGEESNHPALVVRILHNKQKQTEEIVPGVVLNGSLYFYPSMAPLRAELLSGLSTVNDSQRPAAAVGLTFEQPSSPAPGYADLDEAFQAVNHAFSQNPWLSAFPIMVRSARVEQDAKAVRAAHNARIASTGILFKTGQGHKPPPWYLTDRTGMRLLLPEKFEYGWHLAALDQESPEQESPSQNSDGQNSTGQNAATQNATGGAHLFGVWDRTVFKPFTVWQGARWLSLHILKGES